MGENNTTMSENKEEVSVSLLPENGDFGAEHDDEKDPLDVTPPEPYSVHQATPEYSSNVR